MVEYFRLSGSPSDRLTASNSVDPSYESAGACEHKTFRRLEKLLLQVDHTQRDQWLISVLLGGMVFHARLLEEFEKQGFTGCRLKPATVRFRDGYV